MASTAVVKARVDMVVTRSCGTANSLGNVVVRTGLYVSNCEVQVQWQGSALGDKVLRTHP